MPQAIPTTSFQSIKHLVPPSLALTSYPIRELLQREAMEPDVTTLLLSREERDQVRNLDEADGNRESVYDGLLGSDGDSASLRSKADSTHTNRRLLLYAGPALLSLYV